MRAWPALARPPLFWKAWPALARPPFFLRTWLALAQPLLLYAGRVQRRTLYALVDKVIIMLHNAYFDHYACFDHYAGYN